MSANVSPRAAEIEIERAVDNNDESTTLEKGWLIKYFYGEPRKEGQHSFYPCKFCDKTIKIRGNAFYNAERHAKRSHAGLFEKQLQGAGLNSSRLHVSHMNSADFALSTLLFSGKIRANIVADDDFKDFISAVRRNPKWTLPCYDTLLLKHLPTLQSLTEEGVEKALRGAPSISVTLDMWTNRLRHPYLAVAAHFVHNGKLAVALLDLVRLEGSHTADYVLKEMNAVLDRYGVSGKVSIVVTDNGGNLKAAFPLGDLSLPNFSACNQLMQEIFETMGMDDSANDAADNSPDDDAILKKWQDVLEEIGNRPPEAGRIYGHRCLAHLLQLSITGAGGCLKDLNGDVASGKEKIVKAITKYRKSHLKTEAIERVINKQLPIANSTRWDSDFDMLKAALEVPTETWDETFPEYSLSPFERQQVEQLVQVLEPIRDATKDLQGDKYCTAQLVSPYYKRMVRQVEAINTIGSVVRVQAQLIHMLEHHVKPVACSQVMRAATFLDPFFKDRPNAWLREGELDAVQVEVEQLAAAFSVACQGGEAMDVVNDDDDEDSTWGPAERSFTVAAPVSSIMSEISIYAKKVFRPARITLGTGRTVTDLIPFWSSISNEFPLLSKFATVILSIPATEATCERVFSVAGRILTRHGYNMSYRVLRARTFIQQNSSFAREVNDSLGVRRALKAYSSTGVAV